MPKRITHGGVEYNCDECGAVSHKYLWDFLTKKTRFCSRECYNRFRATKSDHYTKKGKKKIIKGSHAQEEWEKVLERFRGKCAFCGSQGKLVKDHVKPLSEGGDNYIENIQPLCRICSNKKFCLGT